MKIIQRIGSDPALLELLLEMQEKHPGCFTDVWLNTAYGYPKNEDHAKVADELAGKGHPGVHAAEQHPRPWTVYDAQGLFRPGF